jgi:hypothetical protein
MSISPIACRLHIYYRRQQQLVVNPINQAATRRLWLQKRIQLEKRFEESPLNSIKTRWNGWFINVRRILRGGGSILINPTGIIPEISIWLWRWGNLGRSLRWTFDRFSNWDSIMLFMVMIDLKKSLWVHNSTWIWSLMPNWSVRFICKATHSSQKVIGRSKLTEYSNAEAFHPLFSFAKTHNLPDKLMRMHVW